MSVRHLIFFLLVAIGQMAYGSEAADALSQLLNKTQTLQSRFIQSQWQAPSTDPVLQEGTFVFAQPNFLRWRYLKPFKQEYLVSGETVYIYDEDLEQGIIRATHELNSFVFSDLFNKDFPLNEHYRVFQHWNNNERLFSLTPLNTEHTPIAQIRLKFKKNTLLSIDIIDALNQRTEIQLIEAKYNAPIPEGSDQIQWPEGTEVFDERPTAQQ